MGSGVACNSGLLSALLPFSLRVSTVQVWQANPAGRYSSRDECSRNFTVPATGPVRFSVRIILYACARGDQGHNQWGGGEVGAGPGATPYYDCIGSMI